MELLLKTSNHYFVDWKMLYSYIIASQSCASWFKVALSETTEVFQVSDCSRFLSLTLSDSWKDAAWYWAYLAMVVWPRPLSHLHIFLVPGWSQFSSAGCDSCVHTSTRCSGFASTRVFVENRPKSTQGNQYSVQNYSIILYYFIVS